MSVVAPPPDGLWLRHFKRPVDLAICIVALALIWPVIVLLVVLIRFQLGDPVIFTQERLGQDGRRFTLYKFRSMTDARDASGSLLGDEKRTSRFGQILRSTSLDELPQILNIFRGEMAIVGPRPVLPIREAMILSRYPQRMRATPGMTSLPAIKGRNALTMDQKFAYDVEYVANRSFIMDMKILFLTIPVVLSRRNIEVEDSTA